MIPTITEILVLLLPVGVPVVILYAAVKAIRRLFRQLNEIQSELREIRSQMPKGD